MNVFGDAALIFFTSAGLCMIVGRPIIRALANAQCVTPLRYEDCPPLQAYQEAKPRTPTMGGLFVLGVGTVVACMSGGLTQRYGWLVLASIIGFGLIGFLDDYLKFRGPNALGLRSMPKLVMALGIGAQLGFASWSNADSTLDIPWLRQTVTLGWVWVPLVMLTVAGSAHAVNLTDGMDGLAAGCLAIALSAFGLWLMATGTMHGALIPWCVSLAGACAGFLWFNGFPASVFLGDVGALGLGAALGTIGALTHAALLLLIIGGVFVVEALSVMLQVASYKWRGKRRIFRVAPIHHHFHLGGINEPKVIVRFWIAGLLLAVLGLTTLRMP